MKPKHKLGGTLCTKCNKLITAKKTNQVLCDKCLEDLVYNYPFKHTNGFTSDEQKELLKQFPDINMDKYYDAMMGNTGMVNDEGKFITYPCDIVTALRCGIENRDIHLSEWD